MNVTARDIDTRLAAIYRTRAGHVQRVTAAKRALASRSFVTPTRKAELTAAVAASEAAVAELEAAAFPLEEIYLVSPWPRFYLVPGGHLHSSTSCSSCRWSTEFSWLPEYSGMSEAEIVGLAGEAACTICYPTAPVNRPSMLPVHVAEREAKAAEEAAKAAKRDEKLAKAINPDGSEWSVTVDGFPENFKTIRSVELALHRITERILGTEAHADPDSYAAAHLGHRYDERAMLSAKLAQRTGRDADAIAAEVEAKVRRKLRL